MKVVRLAVDSDARTNEHVADAMQRLVLRLASEGFDIIVETWPEKFKGIDDALVAPDGGPAVIVSHNRQDMWHVLAEIVEKIEPAIDLLVAADQRAQPSACLGATARLRLGHLRMLAALTDIVGTYPGRYTASVAHTCGGMP